LSAKLNPLGADPLAPLAQRTNTASRPKIERGSACQTHAAVLGSVSPAVIPDPHAVRERSSDITVTSDLIAFSDPVV
jgi:hypothetical protein